MLQGIQTYDHSCGPEARDKMLISQRYQNKCPQEIPTFLLAVTPLSSLAFVTGVTVH